MKRKDVYNTIITFAEEELVKSSELNDPNILGAVRMAYSDKYNSKVDDAFDSVYDNNKSYLFDGFIILVSSVLGFIFIPLPIVFKISIVLLFNLVFQFIKNRGLYFMIKEIKYKFTSEDKPVIEYKPKMGKYVPIVIGKQRGSTVVYDLGNKKIDDLSNPKVYIADKEVLPIMLDKYKTKDSPCIMSVTGELKKDISRDYYVADRLWKESKEKKEVAMDDDNSESEKKDDSGLNHFNSK